nr:hypothetical protein [uncultured bacterium]
MFGPMSGSPNPRKQAYVCGICGVKIPSYQDYCDDHLKRGTAEHPEPPLFRFLRDKIFGRSSRG